MNLKVNSVNFTGKKEVLYAINKAARSARDYEYYNQPAIASRLTTTMQLKQTAQDAYIQAYLDMAIRDSEFKSVVKNATKAELYPIKELLSPQMTEHSLVEPMKKFSEAIDDVVTDNYCGKAQALLKSYVRELLQKLKL